MWQSLSFNQSAWEIGLGLQTDYHQILMQNAGSQLAPRLSRKAILQRSELVVLLSTVIIADV